MAAAVMPTISIAGLHRAPKGRDLEISRAVHNTLPHPEEQPEISDTMLKAVGDILIRHGAQGTFGIHLLHSHFTAPEGTILLGVQVPMTDTTNACWTKPSDGSFVAYEFHEGEASSDGGNIGPAFFREFADFLRRNNLADLLALELLDGPQNNIQKELQVGPQATVLFHEEDVIGLSLPTITTGWSFKLGDDGIISCKGGTVYSAKKDTHHVFVDSKPFATVEALKNALRGEGIIG
ncbi:hypothetical protein BN1723_014249 [Verticillium longisporum]|uniref:Uncharacterized protein n=1 Tax=Verticillium longisporum TaxID=100787 RepID=A0A0G4M4F1_VERLO|nr:hypothetical protein BN1723_014249 [Verticillium longisporum]